MTTVLHTTPLYADLRDLGRRLYEQSLVRREQEYITDPKGRPIGWLLDTRIPMLSGKIAREVGELLASRIRARGLFQVAGYGFGAYSMVCSTLAAPGKPPIRGGFVRETRKPHGRRRLVEGPILRKEPVVLLDDILNSGRSALKALELLRSEGFDVAGLTTMFDFTWSGGRTCIEAESLWVDSLIELNLREVAPSSSDSA